MPGALHHAAQALLQRRKLALGVSLLQEIDLFFGEIQRRFNQHAQMDERIAKGVDFTGELACQGAAGAAGGGFGAGVNQVSHGLGLGQIHLVVQEGALGEFARARDTHAGQTGRACGRIGGQTRLNAARQQQLQHHRPAVGLQLQHVFTGVGMGGREVDRQPLVNHAAVGRAKCQVSGFTGLESAPAEGSNQRRNRRARGAHHAHCATPGRGGNGNNRVIFVS